jgi:hypothetical protein
MATEPVEPFASSSAHLHAELEHAGRLLRLAVARASSAAPGGSPLTGGHPEEELFALLEQDSGPRGSAGRALPPALAEAQATAERLATDIARRRAESIRQGIPLRLVSLAERLGLERFDLDVLLLGLLAELDREAAPLFVRLAPESHGRPTLGTALDILTPTFEARLAARARLGPRAPLLRQSILHLVPADAEGRAPPLSRALVVDEHISAFLQGDDALDPRLQPHVRLSQPHARLEELLLPEALKAGLARFVTQSAPRFLVHLRGAYGTGKRTTVEALCHLLGMPVLAADCAGLLSLGEEPFTAAVQLVGREARLHGAAIHWLGTDAVFEGSPAVSTALLGALTGHPGPTFLSGSAAWEPTGIPGERPLIRVELPRPSAAEQAQLWTQALGEACAADMDLRLLTSTFRLTGGQIRDAAHTARSLARFRGEREGRVTMPDLTAACRSRHGRKLTTLSRRVTAHQGWDSLVLPPDRKAALREFCLQLKHRTQVLGSWGFERKLGSGRPLAALFAGPPGTGKTLAAAVIAAELNVDLYHIDLSQVVSKYIGETEKHLAELFADAEAANAALFFDEADALFGKRTEVRDSHDRYANLETSYLLQRIDSYEGVVILASNFIKNIDEAFVRRLGFMIEFPMPGLPERLRIWREIWPPEVPLGPDLDFAFLAERIELSGGYIRNIALAAAFLAAEEGTPVGMSHLLHAARREYQKLGKVVDASRLAYRAP